jgi:hypothetical protein
VNVSNEGQEIPVILNEEGLVTALKQMTDASVTTIEPLRVRRLDREHDARKRDGPALESEVNVIVHQTIGEHTKSQTPAAVREPSQVGGPILAIAEDRLALVPSRNDVVHASGNLDSQGSRQTPLLWTRL